MKVGFIHANLECAVNLIREEGYSLIIVEYHDELFVVVREGGGWSTFRNADWYTGSLVNHDDFRYFNKAEIDSLPKMVLVLYHLFELGEKDKIEFILVYEQAESSDQVFAKLTKGAAFVLFRRDSFLYVCTGSKIIQGLINTKLHWQEQDRIFNNPFFWARGLNTEGAIAEIRRALLSQEI